MLTRDKGQGLQKDGLVIPIQTKNDTIQGADYLGQNDITQEEGVDSTDMPTNQKVKKQSK
jgi:hypothetical protein